VWLVRKDETVVSLWGCSNSLYSSWLSQDVAVTILSLISSVRPVTGAGRNMRLSLRHSRLDNEEESLVVREQPGTGAHPSIYSQKPRQKDMLICPL
jgi:hypothetical protein